MAAGHEVEWPKATRESVWLVRWCEYFYQIITKPSFSDYFQREQQLSLALRFASVRSHLFTVQTNRGKEMIRITVYPAM